MRVCEKKTGREGEASIPPVKTVHPPGDDFGFVATGKDYVVYFDDGSIQMYSPGALDMLFNKVATQDINENKAGNIEDPGR